MSPREDVLPVTRCARGAPHAFVLPVLMVFAIASGLRAEEVSYAVHGKVTLAAGPPEIASALSAHGVIPDADVLLEYTLDSTVEGTPWSVDPERTQYLGAVLSMRVSIGTYECVQYVGGPFPSNSVIVGDDILQGVTLIDKYVISTWGHDTDELLFGDILPVVMGAGADIPHGKVISDEALLHDPEEFGYFTGRLLGNQSTIDFVFDFDGSGPGPDPDPIDPTLSAQARQGQLGAAAGYARSVLVARKKGVSSPPTQDPEGVKQAATIEKAGDVFDVKFAKAVSKALAKGGSAPLPADASPLAKAALLAGLEALADGVASGVDEDVKADRVLRGKILGTVAKALRKDLLAHAKDAKKPASDTLEAKLSKSEAALGASLEKLLGAGAKQGVVYEGTSAEDVAAAIDALVGEFVLLTLGGGLP